MTVSEHADTIGLAAAASRAGGALSPEALGDFLRGAAAAPEGPDPDAWIDLVAPEADATLRARLRRAREAARAVPAAAPDRAARLARLRGELARRGLDGFMVPRADEHQGEWVPRRADRLAWICGFTGSAGAAAVLRERAALFVDGRYTLQAESEAAEEFERATPGDLPDWLASALEAGARLGYDPWLHTRRGKETLEAACERAGASLIPVGDNPLDAVWEDQPPPPIAPVVAHEERHAGRSAADKRAACAAELAREGLDAAVLTLPDSIAWLLNLRGGDVAFTPLALAFAVLRVDGTVDLFIDRRKLSPGVAAQLGAGVRAHEPAAFEAALRGLRGRVAADPDSAAEQVFRALAAGRAEAVESADPCVLAKAVKNAVELDGARAAHRRDGAALARFLRWLDENAPRGGVDEIAAADRLEAERRKDADFRGPSFPTISGAGPNGAIVHYRVSAESNRPLAPGTFYLVDSGGQYPDGTTDVTRTVAVGAADAEMRDRFTRVLKGHIALAQARFPAGSTGARLDTLARAALWRAGLDYRHGTGHGVGSYLGVHEGPHAISPAATDTALRPGMIVSNEPGYYKTGAWGIRIENLVAVVESAEGEAGDFLEFETLTLAPIDRRAIDLSLLEDGERRWLDAYHARVFEALAPLLDSVDAAWLEAACAPLAAG